MPLRRVGLVWFDLRRRDAGEDRFAMSVSVCMFIYEKETNLPRLGKVRTSDFDILTGTRRKT